MELLRDRRTEFDEAGVQPVGISRDSPWTHIAWTQALDLNFGLLSDWNGEAVHGFGIAHEFRGLKDVAAAQRVPDRRRRNRAGRVELRVGRAAGHGRARLGLPRLDRRLSLARLAGLPACTVTADTVHRIGTEGS